MTSRASSPSRAAAQATAWAWFPAEIAITPLSRSTAVSDASFVSTPRGLNEPVFWNSSAFSETPGPSVWELKTGVRCSRPAIASRAACTSSGEITSGPGVFGPAAALGHGEPPALGGDRPALHAVRGRHEHVDRAVAVALAELVHLRGAH